MPVRSLCALVLFTLGCHQGAAPPATVKQASGGGQQTDTFGQGETPRPVDILFVVDESGSMHDKLMEFREAARDWVEELGAKGVDFRIAVINADSSTEPNSVFKGPDTVLTPDTPQVADRLAERIETSASSSGIEVPFLTSTRALSEPLLSADNAGFLRAEASLAVIIVSDEDDQSELTVEQAQTHFALLKGGAEHAQLFAFGAEEDAPCVFGTGPTPRLKDWADTFASVCEGHAEGLAKIAIPSGLQDTFFLSAPPIPETLQVAVAGVPLHDSFWEYDETKNAIRMIAGFVPATGETITVTYDVVAACLANGEVIHDLSGGTDSWSLFSLCAPADATELVVHTWGGKGDPDLYLRLGDTVSGEQHDARSAEEGVNETLLIPASPSDRWSLGVYGFSQYDGVSMQAVFY